MPVCPNCGTFSEPGKSFCTECGQRLIPPPEEKTDAINVQQQSEEIKAEEVKTEEAHIGIPESEKPSEARYEPQVQSWQEQYNQYRQNGQQQYAQYNQTQYNQTQYAPPEQDTAPASDGKGVGIVSLIFGILGLLCCLFPVFSITGLITGIIGVSKGAKATAKVGLILSIIGLVFFLIALVIFIINGGPNFDFFRNFGIDFSSLT